MQENSKEYIEYKNEKHKLNCERWEFIRKKTKADYNSKRYSAIPASFYRCKNCGLIKEIKDSSFIKAMSVCNNGCYGVGYGSGSVVINGVNDLATTHPFLTKYFIDQRKTRECTAYSRENELFRCPNCNHEKEMRVSQLTQKGFSCPTCGDGVSYPEKFIHNLLQQLDLTYKPQFLFEGYKVRYDFFIDGIIIEVHGEQHYKQTGFKKSLKEEQENDLYKYDLAVLNGYEYNKNYIIIDGRESSLEWMKENVMKSKLPTLLGFREENINWIEIHERCLNSLIKEVCTYYNTTPLSNKEIGRVFNLSKSTVYRYLKIGNMLGWCKYCSTRSKSVQCTNQKTGDSMIFDSVVQAGEWCINQKLTRSQTPQNNISHCCSGKQKSAYGYVWSYID